MNGSDRDLRPRIGQRTAGLRVERLLTSPGVATTAPLPSVLPALLVGAVALSLAGCGSLPSTSRPVPNAPTERGDASPAHAPTGLAVGAKYEPDVIEAVADGTLMPAGADARLTLLDALEADPPGLRTPDVWRAIARLRTRLGDRVGASEAWRTLLARQMIEARDLDALIPAMWAVGAPDELLAAIEAVAPASTDPRLVAERCAARAAVGSPAAARAAVHEALDQRPAEPDLLAALAEIELSSERYGPALLIASQSIGAAEAEARPVSARALWIKARALAVIEPVLAADAFDAAYSAEPRHHDLAVWLGFLVDHGRYDTAADRLAELQQDAPFDRSLAAIAQRLRSRRALLGGADPDEEAAP